MQWAKECSLHSSPCYSSNSSINCFHSIPVKQKTPRYSWKMRAGQGRLLCLNSHLKITKPWFFRMLKFGAYQTLKSGFQLLHLMLWWLISRILNQITRNQFMDHWERQWKKPFSKTTVACPASCKRGRGITTNNHMEQCPATSADRLLPLPVLSSSFATDTPTFKTRGNNLFYYPTFVFMTAGLNNMLFSVGRNNFLHLYSLQKAAVD